MPKVDVAAEIEAAELRVKNLHKKAKQLAGAQKKKFAEFETLNGTLYEGKDVIAEKNDRKAKALQEEIDEMEKVFKKISAKIGPVIRELERMGKLGDGLVSELQEERKTLIALGNSLKRTGGELDQLRAWAADIKGLLKIVSDTADTAGEVAELPATLPNTPKL